MKLNNPIKVNDKLAQRSIVLLVSNKSTPMNMRKNPLPLCVVKNSIYFKIWITWYSAAAMRIPKMNK
jgi:hypothetical protein